MLPILIFGVMPPICYYLKDFIPRKLFKGDFMSDLMSIVRACRLLIGHFNFK